MIGYIQASSNFNFHKSFVVPKRFSQKHHSCYDLKVRRKIGLSLEVDLLRWNTLPGACIIKLITAIIYGFRNKLVFLPGEHFQPSLSI